MTLRWSSLDDLTRALDDIASRPDPKVSGAWPPPAVFAHCAQSIEYSIAGFPVARSALFRATIGRIAARKFISQGFMRHDLAAAIPGAPTLDGVSLTDAIARCRAAIAAFRAHEGSFAPHFAYGPVTREQYEKLHAMHAADHLETLAG